MLESWYSQRLRELVHGARKTKEPDAFLDDVCAHDPELRAAMGSLVHGDDATDGVAERPIGPYRVLREIGRGGMGVVYLAERNDGEYRQDVALKVVKRGMDSEEVVRRFRLERQILANLAHSNIARLLDGGMTEDGRPYFVMEYVQGRPIATYCREQQRSIPDVLRLFVCVCDAVAYAHRSRVLHRDLKPSNILVTSDGTPKLLDFGIAKLLDVNSGSGTDRTDTSLRVLTPRYASPEQLRGLPVNETTDVYSLGVLLYALLTDRHPLDHGSREPREIARAIEQAPPQRPSAAVRLVDGANGRAKDLQGDLDTIVMMALRSEPDRRYKSVQALSEDIQRHLHRQPIAARTSTLSYRSARFLARHRASVAIAAIGVVLGSVVTLFSVLAGMAVAPLSGRATVKSIAVLPFANASRDPNAENIADGITDQLIDSLSQLPTLGVRGHNSVFGFKGKPIDRPAIGQALKVQTLLTGSVALAGDRLVVDAALVDVQSNEAIWTRRYDAQLSNLSSLGEDLARDVSRKLGIELPITGAIGNRHTQSPDAYLLYLKGRYFWNKRDPDSTKKAIAYFQQAIEKDSGYAIAYSGLADAYITLAIYGLYDEGFDLAKINALRAVELDSEVAQPHVSLAGLKWLRETDWSGAEAEFKRAIALNAQLSTAHHWYGLYLAEMGRFPEALVEERRALELDPLSLPINADYGRVLYYARAYDDSLQQYRRTLEIDPTFIGALRDILYVYEAKHMVTEWAQTMERIAWGNRPQLKAAYLESGQQGFWRKYLDTLPSEASTEYRKAEILTQLGEYDRALEMLARLVDRHAFGIQQLKVNPVFDPLRSDPRFIALLRKLNLDR